MPRISNSSMENLNGSAYSGQSTRTQLSLDSTRNGRSRVAAPVYSSLNRNHSYPATLANEYHYRDNSAAGHSMQHSNRGAISSRQEVSSQSDTPPLSNRTLYRVPAANGPTGSDIRDNRNDTHVSPPSQSHTEGYSGQQTAGQNYQYSDDPVYPPPNNNFVPESSFWSYQDSDEEGEDQYYIQQSSTARPHSPTTQRYLQEYSPHDRMRLGLPRFESQEDERRAYESVTHYDTSSFQGRSTRRQ